MARTRWTIGDVASRTGVTRDTLRYYERLGLLAPASRTSGGFRVYASGTIDRVRFIKQAQRQGLALSEVLEFLRAEQRSDGHQCREIRALLQHRLADVDARLRELRRVRRTLTQFLERCDKALALALDSSCPVGADLRNSPK